MPINKKTIEEKIIRLNQAVQLLEQYKKVSKNSFLADQTTIGATLYNMILGIEIIVDIGSHILNEAYQVRPKEYKEVIEKLGEYEIVPPDFAKDNSDMAKFRNLLIHEYIKVDFEKVYNYLQMAPDIFREFARNYIEFIDELG